MEPDIQTPTTWEASTQDPPPPTRRLRERWCRKPWLDPSMTSVPVGPEWEPEPVAESTPDNENAPQQTINQVL
jgi:hypothetical protein